MHLFSISIFEKDILSKNKNLTYKYNFKLNINKPILFQDIEYRKFNKKFNLQNNLNKLSTDTLNKIVYLEKPIYVPGYVYEKNSLITSEYGYVSSWFQENKNKFNIIYVCKENFIPNRGWRVMQKPVLFNKIFKTNAKHDYKCKIIN